MFSLPALRREERTDKIKKNVSKMDGEVSKELEESGIV